MKSPCVTPLGTMWKGLGITMRFDLILAALCAIATSVLLVPFPAVPLVIFGSVLYQRTLQRMRAGEVRLATTSVIASMFLFAAVIAVAAWYPPAKQTEKCLKRNFELPATRMTLAELAYAAGYDRILPVRTSITFLEPDRDKLIQFPKRNLSVREFVAAIEQQTDLRHRFLHCGNGYIILNGGDCSGGLSIRDPDHIHSSGERFDLDAYAAARAHLAKD